MVILFRPYLLDQKTEISRSNNIHQDTEVTSLNNESSLLCRWEGCYQSFENLDMLSSHVAKEHANVGKGGMFYCGWSECSRGDKGFNARYKMLVHVRTHTNEKPHHCYQCNKSFSRAENLKIHSRSHTGEKPYVCTVPGCGKAYSNSSDRFKHSRTHAVDKPYACKVPGCPKRYTDPSSLRKHVKTYKHYPTNNTSNEEPKELSSVDQNAENVFLNRVQFSPLTSHNREHHTNYTKLLKTETNAKTSPVESFLQSYHRLNEIYLWQQCTNNRIQMHETSLVLSNNSDKFTDIDEPLDLRMHCD